MIPCFAWFFPSLGHMHWEIEQTAKVKQRSLRCRQPNCATVDRPLRRTIQNNADGQKLRSRHGAGGVPLRWPSRLESLYSNNAAVGEIVSFLYTRAIQLGGVGVGVGIAEGSFAFASSSSFLSSEKRGPRWATSMNSRAASVWFSSTKSVAT